MDDVRPTIVYIAGKMTGPEDLGREKFAMMEQKLRKKGLIVLNPTSLPDGMPAEKYLPICMAMIDQCDTVVMLDNWQDSKGAKMEREYAKYNGKRIVYPTGKGKGTK